MRHHTKPGLFGLRLPAPPWQAGWQVIVSWMIIIALHSSAFSLQPKHLSSYKRETMVQSVLNNKRLLAVDDEPDILETLKEQLDEFPGLLLDTATDYETGYHLLRSWTYDLVILDIMGVRGFDLLMLL